MNPKHTRANAQLVSAAPDLLAACELAAPCIDSYLNGQGAVTVEELDAALMAIDAALKKARGLP